MSYPPFFDRVPRLRLRDGLARFLGAAGVGGSKGIGGRFDRRNLLAFGAAIPLTLRFTRLDSGAHADAGADLRQVPAEPEMLELMPRCAAGEADAEALQKFAALWQDRVRRLLLEHGEDPDVFIVRCA